ncbi:MAG: hypothetical protein NTY65_04990, partial [Planctomycetota bacterium]|nr:hypothetical protein [Planctomycetota bacterium]
YRCHHLQPVPLLLAHLDPVLVHPLPLAPKKRTFLLGLDRTLLLGHDSEISVQLGRMSARNRADLRVEFLVDSGAPGDHNTPRSCSGGIDNRGTS